MTDTGTPPSRYYDLAQIARDVAQEQHCETIGGQWERMGPLQFEFMRAQGLAPSSRLLDIGCGSLRGGVHFAAYLDAGNYFGTDINQSLLDAGYDIELRDAGVQAKVPRANLVCDGEFRFPGLAGPFDFALAQSVFTHLPAAYLRTCLTNLAPPMRAGGRLFATCFLVPDEHPRGDDFIHPKGVQTHEYADAYHYRRATIRECCDGLPWSAEIIGEWGHPRDQQMVRFERRDE